MQHFPTHAVSGLLHVKIDLVKSPRGMLWACWGELLGQRVLLMASFNSSAELEICASVKPSLIPGSVSTV